MITIACNTTMATKHKTNILKTKYKAILEVEKGPNTKTQIVKDFNVPSTPRHMAQERLMITRRATRPKGLVPRTRG